MVDIKLIMTMVEMEVLAELLGVIIMAAQMEVMAVELMEVKAKELLLVNSVN
jgi:hypothetical protein